MDWIKFYEWIASNAKMFECSKWDDAVKTQGMLQTMPLDKQSAYVHIDSWLEFKDKLSTILKASMFSEAKHSSNLAT